MMKLIRTLLKSMLGGVILLATGCSPYVENYMIEEIAPVIFWSINEGEDGKLKISTVVPPLVQEKKRLLSLQVDLIKQGAKEFNLIYYRELKSGQLRMVFINQELAKKGVMPIINTLLTDPDISQRLFLVIVNGNLEDFISRQLDKQEDLDYFLYRMFKHYEKQGEMSVINLHQFKNKLYSPYVDPILPVFKVNEDNLTYEGTAFFSKDNFVASIKEMDDQIFQLIGNDHYLKQMTMPALNVSLGQARAKVIMELKQDYSSLTIKINLNGRIEEYRGTKNILEPDHFLALNNEIESYLEKQTKELLRKMQEWKVDPLEVGIHTLTPFTEPISDKEWFNHWENMEINVDYSLYLEPMMNVKE